MFEIKYNEKMLPKLISVLRIYNAVYKLDSKEHKLKIISCSPECKYSILALVLKHQSCDICKHNRARYLAFKDGKLLKVCRHCKDECSFDEVKHISLENVELHHDVVTGLLKPCFH
jgi:hypothetical protein